MRKYFIALALACLLNLPAFAESESPFGILEPFSDAIRRPQTYSKEPAYFVDLGAKWAREGRIVWLSGETPKGFNWDFPDKLVEIAGACGAELLFTVSAGSRPQGMYIPPVGSSDRKMYADFFITLLNRYKNKVKYWQIGNEPNNLMRGGKMKSEEYAEFVCFNYQLLKQTCPECKLVLGGISSRPNEYYKFYQKVIEAAKGSFDILDFHWAGMYGDYKSLYGINFKKLVSDIKDDLKNNNTKADIWITEMSTYSGDPQDLKVINFPYQSERQQAIELVKRYVYPLSAGVKKIFWVKIIEWYGFARKINGFYDNTGLVNNPLAEGDSSGKLSFYTYKKMIEVLDGSDWNNIQTIQEKDGIYIYKFTKNGKPIWVAWNDNAEKKEITISDITPNQFLITAAVPNFESGKEIMDYNTAFETEKKVVLEGSVTINIADSPIYIEML